MILQALNSVLSEVMPSYPLIGDIEATMPFCVFEAEASPMRAKEGVCGYDYRVNVGIIDDDIETVNNYTDEIITAMTGTQGTISGTEIWAVINTNESGVYHQEVDGIQAWMNDLEFRVFTKNR